jgi:hypothetical protein
MNKIITKGKVDCSEMISDLIWSKDTFNNVSIPQMKRYNFPVAENELIENIHYYDGSIKQLIMIGDARVTTVLCDYFVNLMIKLIISRQRSHLLQR